METDTDTGMIWHIDESDVGMMINGVTDKA